MVFWHFPCCLFLFNAHRLIRYCTLPYTYNCTVTYTPVWTPSHARCTCAYTHDVRHDIHYCTHAYTEFCTSVYTENARAYIQICTAIYTEMHKCLYVFCFWCSDPVFFARIAAWFTVLQFFHIEFYKIVTFWYFWHVLRKKKTKKL